MGKYTCAQTVVFKYYWNCRPALTKSWNGNLIRNELVLMCFCFSVRFQKFQWGFLVYLWLHLWYISDSIIRGVSFAAMQRTCCMSPSPLSARIVFFTIIIRKNCININKHRQKSMNIDGNRRKFIKSNNIHVSMKINEKSMKIIKIDENQRKSMKYVLICLGS